MQQRLPRIIVLLDGITFSFFGISFLFFPLMIFSQSVSDVLWFRYLFGGMYLFWGLVNFGWDWLPLSHIWNLTLGLINVLGCALLSFISLVDGKSWNLVLFLSLLLVSVLALLLANRQSPRSTFLRLSTVLFLVPFFIFFWQLIWNYQWTVVQSISLLMISLIFTGFLILATLLLLFSANSRGFINLQFIFAFPWMLVLALELFIPGDPAISFLAGAIAVVSFFARWLEQQKTYETSMTSATLRIFLFMQIGVTIVTVVSAIFLSGSFPISQNIRFSPILFVLLVLILVLLPGEFFNQILAGFQKQFESIFIQSASGVRKNPRGRAMILGGVVTALTQEYSSLIQRRDSLSKIRQSTRVTSRYYRENAFGF